MLEFEYARMRLQLLLGLCAVVVAVPFGNRTHQILTHQQSFVYGGYGAKACSALARKSVPLVVEYSPSDHVRFDEANGRWRIPTSSFKINGFPCRGSTVQSDFMAVSLVDVEDESAYESLPASSAFAAVLRDFDTRANDIVDLVGVFAPRGAAVQCAFRDGGENSSLSLVNLVFIEVGTPQHFASGLKPNVAIRLDARRLYIGIELDLNESDGEGTLCTLASQDPGPSSKSSKSAGGVENGSKSKFSDQAIIAFSVALAVVLFLFVLCLVWCLRKRNDGKSTQPSVDDPPTRVVESKSFPTGYKSSGVVMFAEEDSMNDITGTEDSCSGQWS